MDEKKPVMSEAMTALVAARLSVCKAEDEGDSASLAKAHRLCKDAIAKLDAMEKEMDRLRLQLQAAELLLSVDFR